MQANVLSFTCFFGFRKTQRESCLVPLLFKNPLAALLYILKDLTGQRVEEKPTLCEGNEREGGVGLKDVQRFCILDIFS